MSPFNLILPGFVLHMVPLGGGGEKEMEEEGKEEKPYTGVTWTRRLVDEAA